MVMASRWSWVTTIVVMPRRCCSWRSSTCIASRSLASSADSGSSSRNSRGESASARAMATRCRWPPDSCAIEPLAEARQVDEIEELADALAALRLGDPAYAERIGDVLADVEVREERQRLEHHAEVARCAGTPVMSLSSTTIRPAVGSSRPAIIRKSVVFPQPDGPRRQTKVPWATRRSTSSTAVDRAELLRQALEREAGHDVPVSRPSGRSGTRCTPAQPTISSVHFWFSQSAFAV